MRKFEIYFSDNTLVFPIFYGYLVYMYIYFNISSYNRVGQKPKMIFRRSKNLVNTFKKRLSKFELFQIWIFLSDNRKIDFLFFLIFRYEYFYMIIKKIYKTVRRRIFPSKLRVHTFLKVSINQLFRKRSKKTLVFFYIP